MIYPNSLLSSMQLILGIKMMGMSEFDNNLSWLITTVAQMTYWCLLYRCSLQPLCLNIRTSFLYSSTLRRSVLHKSSLLGPIIFFVSFFPYKGVNDPDFSTTAKTATCILAPACFALRADVFVDYKGGLLGIQVDNYYTPSFNFSNPLCLAC